MERVQRWPGLTDEEHSRWYINRFRSMAESGRDLDGEARLMDAMLPRHARVLDAGCGPGRAAGYLHKCGHQVTGVDIDPLLIEAAEQDYPGPTYAVADLADLTCTEPFDAALCAGNVMAFVAEDSEADVLAGIRRCVRADGFALVGFHVDRYPLTRFDEDAARAGWRVEQRFATWDVRPWTPDCDFAVTVLRTP